VDLEHVAEALLAHNVKIHTLSRYYLGPQTQAGLVFGYGAAEPPEIERGVALLREALSA
jgi:GntR family transcriptional regulator/MocR family aminotransferase